MVYGGKINNITEKVTGAHGIYSAGATAQIILDSLSWNGPMKTISFKISEEMLNRIDYAHHLLGYENRSMFIRRLLEAFTAVFETMMSIDYIDRDVPTRDVEIKIMLRYGCVTASTTIIHTSIAGNHSVSGITRPHVTIDKDCRES